MTAQIRVGAVVLTYNSTDDLATCLDGLLRQTGVDLRIIVVDNASAPQNQILMQSALRQRVPDAQILSVAEATADRLGDAPAVFVANDRNAGYSAGNNVGARLAIARDCEAVLIVNPDVRIENPVYVATLARGMRMDPTCLVASSRIVGLSGRDENPIRELGFWEELLWPRRLLPKALHPKSAIVPPTGTAPLAAEKVHGCCMLVRSSFLEASGYLDENVFLYCEEPVLGARVRRQGGRIVVFPEVTAVHAHVKSRKGSASRRMLQFARSRLYYLETYSGYSPLRRAALHASYGLLVLMHTVKARLSRS